VLDVDAYYLLKLKVLQLSVNSLLEILVEIILYEHLYIK